MRYALIPFVRLWYYYLGAQYIIYQIIFCYTFAVSQAPARTVRIMYLHAVFVYTTHMIFFRSVTGSARCTRITHARRVKLGDQHSTQYIIITLPVYVRSSVNYDPNFGDRMLRKQFAQCVRPVLKLRVIITRRSVVFYNIHSSRWNILPSLGNSERPAPSLWKSDFSHFKNIPKYSSSRAVVVIAFIYPKWVLDAV